MKKLNVFDKKVVFHGEEGEELTVSYDNRGEPYMEGASFMFEDSGSYTHIFLEKAELRALRDLLCKLCEGKR